MEKIAILTLALMGIFLSACQTEIETNSAKPAITATAKEKKSEITSRSFISVDGISLPNKLPQKFAIVAPKDKETNILFEQVKKAVSDELCKQGYISATPEEAEMIVVLSFASSSREGQIVIGAYDKKQTLKNIADAKATEKEDAKNYKLIAKTLIYYVNADNATFQSVFADIVKTTGEDLLKNVIPTKYYQK